MARDRDYFVDVIGGRCLFAVEGMGARVAMIELGSGPRILLTDHLEGERSVLIYRVADLRATLSTLRGRGWQDERSLEIPTGPCHSFRAPGGQRVAVYELSRPEVARHFEGRRDF